MTLEVSPELERRLKVHSLRQGKTEHQLLEEILQQALPEIAPKKHDWIGAFWAR
jgi:predicted DNA-binding protein